MAIVLAYGENGELLTLVGRRNPKSRFLGGYFAFPGGVWEPADGDIDADGEDVSLRRNASRELREETGLEVGPGDFLAAGRRITPPFFPRRFDTRMYVIALDRPREPAPEIPGELEDLHWTTPAALHERWFELEARIAPPLIPMLEELSAMSTSRFPEIAERLARVNAEMESGGPRIEFVPDVLMIPVRTPTLPPATHTNCYLVGSREFLIVDPGSADQDECDRLLSHVAQRSGGGRVPRAVVLTHHHGDHTGGVLRVSRELGLPVMAHPATWKRWADGDRIASPEEIREGDRITLSGGESIRVMHTPGHAEGHVALFVEPRSSLLAGDLVSGVSTILVDSRPGSLDRYLESLERIRDTGARTLFPAHGPPMIAPARAVQRVIDHRTAREDRVMEALEDGPKAVDEVARLAYRDTPGAAPALAVSQTASHLDRLERQGRVRLEGEHWRLDADAGSN